MNLELLILGGYGQFVWPAFIFTFVSCFALYAKTKKEFRKQEKMFLKEFKQMQTLDQVVFTGFTHEPAVKLAEELLSILPKNQAKVMFNDNGSTSVEIGIKMALQFHHNNNDKRDTLLAFENGFHGDTFGAMSVSGLSVYNGPFDDHFLKVVRIPTPDGTNNAEVLKQLNALIETQNIAGFVYEPLVQGAAGMKMYDAQGLNEVLKVCKANKPKGMLDTGTQQQSTQTKIQPINSLSLYLA